MNQGQRFDDLTRALATNQLSRWQLLKGLGATMVAVGSLGAWWKTLPSAEATPKATTCSNSTQAQCVQDASDRADTALENCEQVLAQCTGDPLANQQACGVLFLACRSVAGNKFKNATRKCEQAQCGGGLQCTNDTCCKQGFVGCNGSCYDPANCEDCVNGVIERGCPPPQECDGAGNCVCPGVTQECGDSCCNPDKCERCGANGQCEGCGPCEECKPVADPIGGTVFQCVPLPETTPCGSTCCGSCQTCDGVQCRNCDPNPPRCEICVDGRCDAMTCEEPKVLNTTSCQCECPPPPPPPIPSPGACTSQPECLCGQRPMGDPPRLGNVYCNPEFNTQCCIGPDGYAYCCKAYEKCNPAGGCFPC